MAGGPEPCNVAPARCVMAMQTELVRSTGQARPSGRLLVLMLVAATLGTDAAAVCWHGLSRDPSAQIVLAALASSQVGLLAIWAGLGSWANPWRSSALAATLLGWSLLLSQGETPVVSPVQWLVQAASVIVMLFAESVAGAKERDDAAANPAGQVRTKQRWQFSLGNLMGCTTNAAVWLGVVEYARQTHARIVGDSPWVASASFVGFGDGLIALGCLWLVVGNGRPVFRTLRCFLAFAIACFADFRLAATVPHRTIVTYLGLQALLLTGSLVVLWVAEVRLLRQWSARQAATRAPPL